MARRRVSGGLQLTTLLRESRRRYGNAHLPGDDIKKAMFRCHPVLRSRARIVRFALEHALRRT